MTARNRTPVSLVIVAFLAISPTAGAQEAAPVPRAGDAASLALVSEKTHWQPVRSGIELDEAKGGGLRLRYERLRGRPAGLARSVPSGGLNGLGGIELRVSGGRGVVLLLSLRDAAGRVFSWPMRRLSGESTELSFDPADLRLDARQSRGREGPFRAAAVEQIRLLDISGYLGGASEAVVWSVEDATLHFGSSEGVGPTGERGLEGGPAGEALFLRALVEGRGRAEETLASLRLDAVSEPERGRPQLLLGLAHLRIAAEGDRGDPRLPEHLVLADRYFTRAARLDPGEGRLASWQVPVRLALAGQPGEKIDVGAEMGRLDAAVADDPGFHGFARGLVSFGAPLDSEAFAAGRRALHAALAADPDDPSVRNRPLWPHNREGFLLFVADTEQRAGNQEEARRLLSRIEEEPSFENWPYRDEVARRRTAWSEGRSLEFPNGWMQERSCTLCHRR